MDVVTLGAAKSYVDTSATTSNCAVLMQRLAVGNEDAVLTVLSDSTGDGTTRWPYLVAQRLAAAFPAYTVKVYQWVLGSNAYGAVSTIQTGTGPRTLTVYIGAASGMDVAYALTWFTTLVPVTPNLLIVNYSHNSGGSTAYRSVMYGLTRRSQDWYPSAGIVLTAQNPQDPGNANYAAGLTRDQQVMDLAGSEGYGLINVTQPFLDTPNYQTVLLNTSDGLGVHPNDTAGSPLWASIVMKQLKKAVAAVPRTPPVMPHRVWVPATAFMAAEGAPTLSVVGVGSNVFPAWTLDPTTQQRVVSAIDYPDNWQTLNAYVVWAVLTGAGYTGGTLGVRWGLALARNNSALPWNGPASGTTTNMSQQGAYSDSLTTGGAANSGAYAQFANRVISDTSTIGRPLALRVSRIAADAADTLAEAVFLRGVMLERAS